MRFTTRWIDVTYEAVFAAPAFDLPSRNISVLKAFYEAINPRFAITMNNLQAMGGTSVADVRARIVLFNGSGILDVSAEKFSAVFTNLRARSDVEIIKDCIRIAEGALRSALPDIQDREVNINSTVYIELADEGQSAIDFLGGLTSSRKVINPKAFNASEVHYGLSAEIVNSAARWRTSLRVEAAQFDPRILIMNSRATYPADGALQSFEDQARHVEQVLETVARELGLEMAATA
jgi:hypothetical protein